MSFRRKLTKTAIGVVAFLLHCSSAFVPHYYSFPRTTTRSCSGVRQPGSRSVQRLSSRSLRNPSRPLPRRRQQIKSPSRANAPDLGKLNMASEDVEGEEAGQMETGGEREDPRLYSVRISRVTGIEWGTDLSFSWVYVRALQPSGAAANCGEISVGDQLIKINDNNLVGVSFDAAMGAMMDLQGPDVEFTFFRGTTDELKETVGAKDPPAEITVTVKQKGNAEIILKAPSGANLRNLLTDNGINVYQSVTRWTNCKGKQLCGTCIVEINEGLQDCTVRSLDESSTLRDNPANYRLSCVTDMYDDVTVTVFPPVGAAQWTR